MNMLEKILMGLAYLGLFAGTIMLAHRKKVWMKTDEMSVMLNGAGIFLLGLLIAGLIKLKPGGKSSKKETIRSHSHERNRSIIF